MPAAGPNWVRVACPLTAAIVSVAVIVAWPGVVELVIVAEYVPSPLPIFGATV